MFLKSVVYALEPEHLIVRIKLNQWYRRNFNIDLYVFGYANNVPFADMPKIHVRLNLGMDAVVFNGRDRVRNAGAHVFREGNDIFVSMPLASLGDPQKVISSVAMRIDNLPLESSSWTVMGLNHGS